MWSRRFPREAPMKCFWWSKRLQIALITARPRLPRATQQQLLPPPPLPLTTPPPSSRSSPHAEASCGRHNNRNGESTESTTTITSAVATHEKPPLVGTRLLVELAEFTQTWRRYPVLEQRGTAPHSSCTCERDTLRRYLRTLCGPC